jgi:hypothetical protein
VSFAAAKAIANAVLYEGYVLYPYRASSAKNRTRFQFGVVAPQAYVEAGGSDAWTSQTECLIEPALPEPRVDLEVRCLQLQARRVEAATAEGGGFQAVEALDLDGELVVPWDEGVERQLEVPGIAVRDLLGTERVVPFVIAGGRDLEMLRTPEGRLCGRLLRDRWPIAAEVRLAAAEVDGLLRLRVRVENRSPWPSGAPPDRDLALRCSLLGAHTLLAVRDGAFVSLLDPPAAAARAAAGCSNLHTWPVLVGPEGSRDMVLSSPIILYDHPAVAAESPGDLCDATEIDEILTLRVMTLTEEEKREARGTDPRARQIVERADAMPPEIFERLHGAVRAVRSLAPNAAATDGAGRGEAGRAAGAGADIRSGGSGRAGLEAELASWEAFLNPPGTAAPEAATLETGGVRLGNGSRVRLRPSRRADSMDMFLSGRTARVVAVHRDLEDAAYLAVTLDDDPAGDLHAGIGRFYYFAPDEVEPLDPPEPLHPPNPLSPLSSAPATAPPPDTPAQQGER